MSEEPQAGGVADVVARKRALDERIARACAASGEGHAALEGQPPVLVGVSKRQPVWKMRAALEAGVSTFGENYVNELLGKQAEFNEHPSPGLVPRFHLVGRLQRNKAKQVVGRVDLIHAVDSEALADALQRACERQQVSQSVLVQVNLGGEATKAGVSEDHLEGLLRHIATLPDVSCLGLMTMPPPGLTSGVTRGFFARLRDLLSASLRAEVIEASILSMGMSEDFELAIAEGSTLIRIGTALFGPRS